MTLVASAQAQALLSEPLGGCFRREAAYCTLDMNRLIQMEAAARWRLLISAAAHRARRRDLSEISPAHPGFWLRDQ